MTYRRPSLDKNHAAIVASAWAVGYSVYDGAAVGGGCSDLIIADRNKTTILFEIKNGETQSYFYLSQIRYLANWRGHAAIVKTFDDVQRAMGDPNKYCLSDKVKSKLLIFLEEEIVRVIQENPKADLKRHKVYTKRLEKIYGTG